VLPRFRAGAFWVFALSFVGSFLLGDASFGDALRFDPAGVTALMTWWQPFTAPFVYPEWGLYGVGVTLIVQWVIGSRLEELWGMRRYLVFALVTGVVAYAGAAGVSLAWAELASRPPTGLTPVDAAVLVAFAVAFRGQSVALPGASSPIPAGALSLILALPVVGSPVFGGGGVGTLVPVGIAAVVAVLFVQPWRSSPKTGKVGRKKVKNKAGLRLVHSAEDLLN
jgi:membrane associated rhomboid family serine protease